jgi:beta-galactosidase
LERDKWSEILDQVLGLGFGMVETYIPWSVHETSPGVFDWGETDARKDIEGFMRLCEEKEIYLLVRPGPLINAELTDFGYPEWVLLDPAVQARTALDTIHFDAAHGLHPPHQFPVPSYASEAFYKYVEGWFDAICPIMARHLAPQGCIVAVQSDNETCYLFHEEAYATDYAPDSLKLYRAMLHDKYGDTENLNRAHHAQFESFDDLEPPRDCEIETRADVPRHIDWVNYKEYQIIYAVGRIARIMRERGIVGVPLFHDVAFQYSTPLDVVAMENDPAIDWVGMNLYRNKEEYGEAVKRMRYLAGTTRLPFVPEFGAGLWSHHYRTFTPDEHEFITMTALMYGLKAFNFYMLVERDRWQGSPITRHGTLRETYAAFYLRLMEFLSEHRFWEFERQRDTIVLFNYDAGRYDAATTTMGYAHADLLGLPRELFQVIPDLEFEADPKVEADERPGSWIRTVTDWLGAHHTDFDFGDTHLDAARLKKYAHVLVPTVDFLDPCAQEQLLTYAREGGDLILGPVIPSLTPGLEECRPIGEFIQQPGTVILGAGRLTWATTAELSMVLAQHLGTPSYTCDKPEVGLGVHRHGERELLFAANPTATACLAKIQFEGARTFQPAWHSAPAVCGNKQVEVELPPYTVRIWEVSRD